MYCRTLHIQMCTFQKIKGKNLLHVQFYCSLKFFFYSFRKHLSQSILYAIIAEFYFKQNDLMVTVSLKHCTSAPLLLDTKNTIRLKHLLS